MTVYYDNGGVTLTDRELRGPGVVIAVGSITSVVHARADVATNLYLVGVGCCVASLVCFLAWFNTPGWQVLVVSVALAAVGTLIIASYARSANRAAFRLTLAVPGSMGYVVDFSDPRVCAWFNELLAAVMAGRAPATLPEAAHDLPPHAVALRPVVGVGRTAN